MLQENSKEKIDVILLAAGKGTRMGLSTPKPFLRIGGKPIIAYSLDLFEKIGFIGKKYITCIPEKKEVFVNILKYYKYNNIFVIDGGKTRQESVYNALQHVETNRVIIHESVRPFITSDLLNRIKEEMYDGVVPVIPVSFTVLYGSEFAEKLLQRDKLKNIQLPQIFNTSIIKECHEKAVNDNFFFTEDSGLLLRYGYKVKFCEGLEYNIKITTQFDLRLAEELLNAE